MIKRFIKYFSKKRNINIYDNNNIEISIEEKYNFKKRNLKRLFLLFKIKF